MLYHAEKKFGTVFLSNQTAQININQKAMGKADFNIKVSRLINIKST